MLFDLLFGKFFNTREKRKPLFIFAFLAVPFVFVVIALGAFTRLADAGLGCPDWPTCYGHILWPSETHEITVANMKYNETPVEAGKTWPEQVHRIFASSLGVISLMIFIMSIRMSTDKILNKQLIAIIVVLVFTLFAKIANSTRLQITSVAMHDIYDLVILLVIIVCFVLFAILSFKNSSSKQPLKLPAFIVGFVILQGLFGMWTVTLKVWPQIVTLHLLGGFAMASLFWLLALRLNNKIWQLSDRSYQQIIKIKPIVILGFAVVILQIALGGWTTSNYAAVACPDLPTCQGVMWPEMNFYSGFNITQGIGPNYLGGNMDNESRVAIHMAHRIGAIITSIILLFLAFWLTKKTEAPETRKMGITIATVLFIQICLGLSNIIFNFPLFVAVAHNAGGAILLLTMVTLMHRVLTLKQAV